MTDEQVLLSADRDGVRTLTLNRPDRKNALNGQLWVELADALRAANRDRGLRALVLTGAGGAFCSGADISVPEDIHPRYKLLPKLVGLQQAKRLVLLADMIGADEAHQLGLVTWVKPADEIDVSVDDLVQRLAAGPPLALAQSEALLNDGANATLREALANEARAQPGNFATADSGEAYAAFAGERDASFTGRWTLGKNEEQK